MSTLTHIAWVPIVRSLMRQKFTSLGMVVQIALTLAIISNGLFIAVQRLEAINRHSGLDEQNSFFLTSSGASVNFVPRLSIQDDLRLLRSTEGIVNAVQSNSLPYSDSGKLFNLRTAQDDRGPSVAAAQYKFDHHGLQAFDLALMAGENFTDTEIIWQSPDDNTWPAQALVTQALAKNLFGDTKWQQALGKAIYIEDLGSVIVKGIIDKLQAPWVEWPKIENVIVSPIIETPNSARYLMRTEPGRLDELMQRTEQMLAKANTQRMIRKIKSITQAKQDIYANDIATTSILFLVVCVVSLVSLMGVAGITSFNISKRHQQIGTRRALGASRNQIVWHFLAENFLLSIVGAGVGMLLGLGMNIFLVKLYALAPITWYYLPFGALLVVLIGQLATLLPATKASDISPSEATKVM